MHTFKAATDVPWSTVGPGWFLISVASSSTHLVLVDPNGRHYPVYTAAGTSWQVVGWSGDGQRVLLQADNQRRGARTDIVDLRRGSRWRPVLPTGVHVLGFTRPNGIGLLTASVSKPGKGGYTHYRIERRSLDGSAATVISRDLVPDFYAQHVVYTPDGAHVVTVVAGRLSLVSNATGAVVRSLGPPGMCTAPVRMWDETHVLVACSSSLFVEPLAGGDPVPLVRASTRRGPDYVDIDAFRTSDGSIFSDSLGACGYEFVGRVARNGRVSETKIPHAEQNTQPLAVRGSTVAVAAILGCEGAERPPSLFWWNPKSGAEQVIWAPRRGDRGVAFIPFQSAYTAPLQAGLP